MVTNEPIYATCLQPRYMHMRWRSDDYQVANFLTYTMPVIAMAIVFAYIYIDKRKRVRQLRAEAC